MFEIYKITCKINNKIYIGITSNGVENRWKQHIRTAYNTNHKDANSIFKKAIRKYKPENFTIDIIDTAQSEQEAEEKEIYYIKKYNTFAFDNNSNGYNSTRGGDGTKGHGTVPIVEIDIKSGAIINEYDSFKAAEEHYGHRINHIYDLSSSISTTLNTFFMHKDIALKFTKADLKEKVYQCCNPIVQLDKDGKLIDIWATVNQIVSTLKISQGNLSSALAGNRRFASGFAWIRYNEYIENSEAFKIREKRTTGIKIGQYTLNGKLIKVFDSITQITYETGIHHSYIINVCKNRIDSYGGYIWKYESNNDRKYNAEKIEENRQNRRNQRKNINKKQKDKPYTIIDILTGEKFHSIKEIEDLKAISGKTITNVLNGKREEYKGHKWQYIDKNNT